MNIKYILILLVFIVFISILSELNNRKTKQQLEEIRYEAEESLKDSKKKPLKNNN